MRGTRAALLVGLSGAELLELSGLVIRRHRSVRCGICPGRAIAASASPIATIATDRRGALLAAAITGMFVCGLMMQGAMFQPQSGDLLTTLINTGGFIGNLCSGILYLLSVWFGYNQPDMAGHVHDYGTKFLVTAGLLNVPRSRRLASICTSCVRAL